MSVLADWIEEKTGGIASAKLAWQSALHPLVACGLHESKILLLADSSQDSGELSAFCRLLFKEQLPEGKSVVEVLESFFQEVDVSQYGLSSWIAAFGLFQRWLIEAGRTARFDQVLGYIQCAEEAASLGHDGRALTLILAEMLERYGFEG